MALVTLTSENFQKEVLESNVPVLVDFWASWCGPCKMLSPLVDKVAATATDFKVGKVNVDDEMEIAQAYGVASIPTLICFKNGQVYKTSVGVVPMQKILDLVK